MYYINPITKNPYVKEYIDNLKKDTSHNSNILIEQQKKSPKDKTCMGIELFLLMLFILDIFGGFYFIQDNTKINIYHFINENIVPAIYLVTQLTLSVYKDYPNLSFIKINFYSKLYIFFLIYIACFNIITSYHIDGFLLFLIVGFGLAILYLSYFIYTSSQALDSFIKATANPDSDSEPKP